MTFLLLVESRRPKTMLIFNNKYLCSSNSSNRDLSKENNERSIVIIVLSKRNNFMNRNLIRNTWGSIRHANNIKIVAVVFMLGSRDESENENTDLIQLEHEVIQFGDIIMGDFVDTYRNLTRKAIMAYEWLSSFCMEAQLVVKTDDDVLVNIFKLTEDLAAFTPTEVISSNFWCSIHNNETMIKDKKSRFYVSPEEIAGDVFPRHCAGLGYVTPMGVINRIINEVSRSFLGILCTHEDVFITGIVLAKVNSYKSSENNRIGLINRINEWYTYALENELGDDAQFLVKLLQQPPISTENFDEFRQRFGTRIFYLLTHGTEFENRYLRLWQIIERTFH